MQAPETEFEKHARARQIVLDQLNRSLPARPVSKWNAKKHHYLRRYMQIFSVGMKKWSARTYVDLFAGPGMCRQRDGTREPGSPLIALDRPFTHYAFVEYALDDVRALEKRVAAHPSGDRAKVIWRDCNAAISEVRKQMPPGGLTLAFVDPTSWQVSFDTIRRLTVDRRVDLIVTFHVGGMRRVADREQPKLDQFFGTTDWRPIVARQKLLAGDLLDVYRHQLEKIGYVFDATTPAIRVENSTGAPMYYLLFASKNPKGYEFWRKIAKEDEGGQLTLDFR